MFLIMRLIFCFGIGLLGIWTHAGWANSLSPEQVLKSSQRHFPEILKSLAQQQVAEGKALSTEGAFDLVFSADGYARATGFWDGRVLTGKVEQDLGRGGVSVYSEYRISDGSFPIYEDEYFTNQGGEFKVGVLFSLLRDRTIDKQRFERNDASLAVRTADLQLLLTQIGVQQQALIAYWRWVTTGNQISIYEDLLSTSLARESGLAEQVKSGAQAEISLIENRQNITRRQALVTSAKREFDKATNRLGFYFRTDDGLPSRPDALRLPEASVTLNVIDVDSGNRSAFSQARAQRPELQLLENTIERTLQRITLDENSLKPRLDLGFALARDIGALGEGGPSREGTDTIIGLQFSMPLQRRAERGKLLQSRARLESQRQQQRQLSDQIEVEVRNIVLDLNAAQKLAELARLEVGLAKTLRDAERTRFERGASDFFLINLREQAAADAERRHLYTLLEAQIARTNYDAAVVDLERLGLTKLQP